jgi:hypothetical protein
MPALVWRAAAPPGAALTADLRGASVAGSGKARLSPQAQGGTRIKDSTFEGGLLDSTTGVDSTSGTVNLETAAPLKDAQSATIPNHLRLPGRELQRHQRPVWVVLPQGGQHPSHRAHRADPQRQHHHRE